MDFDVSTPTVELQMPSWLGVYSLGDSWETLHEVTAADEARKQLAGCSCQGRHLDHFYRCRQTDHRPIRPSDPQAKIRL